MGVNVWHKIFSESKMENTLEIRCQCGDYGKDHLVTLTLYKELDEPALAIGTGLNHYLGFWKRLKVGVKYILGIDNTYHSHVECLIECPSQIKGLKSFVDEVAEQFSIS